MGELLALTYIGEGAYRPDLPKRDLDQADIALLTNDQRQTALTCGLYRATFEPDENEAGEPISRHDALEAMTKAELLDVAASQALDLGARPTNAELVDAIEANEKRLAKEAKAQAKADANQGGDATPGDDPAASVDGEPGTPPAVQG